MKRQLNAPAVSLALAAALALGWSAPLGALAVVGRGAPAIYESSAKPMTAAEVQKVEAYLRRIFNAPQLRVTPAPPDAEVYLGEHFMGFVYPDDQKEGRTFYFEMAIFEEELDESLPARRQR